MFFFHHRSITPLLISQLVWLFEEIRGWQPWQGPFNLICRVTRIHPMMKTKIIKNISWWTSMEQQPDSSWLGRTGKEFRLTLSQAVADCWVGTGLESSSANSKRATRGAVFVSKTITWDQKTPAKSTQPCSSEEAQNASVPNAKSKWN